LGPVVITGNNHHHFVGHLKSDYRNDRFWNRYQLRRRSS
jgi:hypothetical protein